MSFLVKILFLACVLVATAKPLTEEERQAMFADLIAKCKQQEGASDFDIQELVAKAIPTTRSGQCLNACILENIGMIKDGKLSVEGSIKLAETSGDPNKVKNSEIVAKQCESAVGTDRCDSTVQIYKCIEKAAGALGLDPNKDLM